MSATALWRQTQDPATLAAEQLGTRRQLGLLTGRLSFVKLPDPMLASGGEVPTGDGWCFEPKWDGILH